MSYWLWVPIVTVYYIVSAILTKKISDQNSWNAVLVLVLLNLLGPWPFVAKYSKNLLFDGLLYDLVIIGSYYVTLILLGAGKSFNVYQWIACSIIVLGIVMMKLSG